MSVRYVLSVYHAGGHTRDVDPMSGYFWPIIYNAEPTLAQYWATVSCLTPRWIKQAFVQSIMRALQPA